MRYNDAMDVLFIFYFKISVLIKKYEFHNFLQEYTNLQVN